MSFDLVSYAMGMASGTGGGGGGGSVLSGNTPPTNTQGSDGDYYIWSTNWGDIGYAVSGWGWVVGAEWYTSVANEILSITENRRYYKTNNGGAIVFQAVGDGESYNGGPVIASTDRDSAYFQPQSSTTPFPPFNTTFELLGMTWYFGQGHAWQATSAPTAGITYWQNKQFLIPSTIGDNAESAAKVKEVLQKIGVFPSTSKPRVVYQKVSGVWVAQ